MNSAQFIHDSINAASRSKTKESCCDGRERRPRYTAGHWGLIFQVNTWVMTDGSVERNFLDDELLQLITIPCNLIQ